MKLLIGIAAAVIAISVQTARAETYHIQSESNGPGNGRTVRIERIDNGKPAPQMSRTYIRDSNGNLRDPVTGWPKGRNY
jgi:hypothetical protein